MRLVIALWLSLACVGEGDDSGADSAASGPPGYSVAWSTNPDPLIAGEEGTFTERVLLDGEPIPDLQASHTRYVHSLFISADLASFTHTHMEDFAPITADAIRISTFSFPVTLPLTGDYLVAFDYAHQDEWLQTVDSLTGGGDLPQAAEPELDFATTVLAGSIEATLRWDVAPVPGYEAIFTIVLRTESGEEVTDLIPWLGADGHAVMVDTGLDWLNHTHAWFPDAGNMTPGMSMPHIYDGPELPFHYTFPVSGTYKMWVQFVRESAPDTVHVVPFVFAVEG